jgi:Ras-related protein Rab-32
MLWNWNCVYLLVLSLKLWDIAGQERYGSMTRVYYKDAVAALIVFDVSHPKSFESVAKWKRDVEEKVFLPDGRPIPCVLLANKCDLQNNVYKSPKELDTYIEETGIVKWFETSAKTGVGIDPAINCLLDKVLEDAIELRNSGAANNGTSNNTVRLDKNTKRASTAQPARAGCCD